MARHAVVANPEEWARKGVAGTVSHRMGHRSFGGSSRPHKQAKPALPGIPASDLAVVPSDVFSPEALASCPKRRKAEKDLQDKAVEEWQLAHRTKDSVPEADAILPGLGSSSLSPVGPVDGSLK
eukprot:11180434-Lingulodinium_polyedra.AAC.1